MSGIWTDATPAGIALALQAGDALEAAGFREGAELSRPPAGEIARRRVAGLTTEAETMVLSSPAYDVHAGADSVTVRVALVGSILATCDEVLSHFAQALRDRGFTPQQLDDRLLLLPVADSR